MNASPQVFFSVAPAPAPSTPLIPLLRITARLPQMSECVFDDIQGEKGRRVEQTRRHVRTFTRGSIYISLESGM